jgi:uncharacterized lipoprotein YmbA
MERNVSRVAAACALVLVTGCLGRTPRPVFYTLTPAVPPPVLNASDDPIMLAVGPASLPSYLDRPQIATRTGARVSFDEYRRWAAPLESELLRVLGANLSGLLRTDRVAIYPTEPRFAIDYRISLQVERFDGSPDGDVVLQARWAIMQPRALQAAAIGFSDIRQAVDGSDDDAFVQAHSAAAGALAAEIAERLGTLTGLPVGTIPITRTLD